MRIGAVADDHTGASDLAGILVNNGMRVVQVVGVPQDDLVVDEFDAVIVALKTRTVPVEDAVELSLAALEWLRAAGAEQIFFKYCSTFDSTPAGNIGPVMDALLANLPADVTIACPSYPDNGRTVKDGCLYVHDVPLNESSMKDHPLTPMTDANLVRVLQAQSTQRVGLIDLNVVQQGAPSIIKAIAQAQAEGFAHLIVDAETERDLAAVARAVDGMALVTGGAALAAGLPANFGIKRLPVGEHSSVLPRVKGRTVIFAGSCSTATRGQVARAKAIYPYLEINPLDFTDVSALADHAVTWFERQDPTLPALIYSSADPESLATTQNMRGREEVGDMLENAFGMMARKMLAMGVRRYVVAGGETSGAVVASLGIKAMRICAEIDPGVPWTESLEEPALALAMKSGNFGVPDFFSKAIAMLS